MKIDNLQIMPVGQHMEPTANSFAPQLLFNKILSEGTGTVYTEYMSGYSDSSWEELSTLLESKMIAGERKIFESFYDGGGDVIYQWESGMVHLIFAASGSISLTTYSLDKEFIISMKKDFSAKLSETSNKGFIFAIMKGAAGLQLTRIGYAGALLERGNYGKQVLSDYDYTIKDLKSDNPSGRITILEGQAGTGKTWLVRSLLTESPDAMFILVPPTMVSSLGGPDLLPLLLRTKQDYNKSGPIILILEDADECLVPRAGDNMASISSILNLGDGIFGSLFDIRIIATTNAKKAEMDPAIIRAGRLSKRIDVLPMSFDDANVVFQRLVPGKVLEIQEESHDSNMRPRDKKNKITLAEIYKAARENGWVPPAKEKDKKSSNKLAFADE